MSDKLKRYVEIMRLSSRVRQQVRADERIALEALFHLNIWCKAYPVSVNQHLIYGLKSLIIKHLYEQNRCVSVRMQKQTLQCSLCQGTGSVDFYGDDEGCPKCGGTGIWREHLLYCFTFQVHGGYYTWHQPESQVLFKPQVTEPRTTPYEDARRGGARTFELALYDKYKLAAYWYLRQQGYSKKELPQMPTLWGAIRRDVRNSTVYWRLRVVRNNLGFWMRNVRRLQQFITTGVIDPYTDSQIDIPF